MAETLKIDAESLAAMSPEAIEEFKQFQPGASIEVVKRPVQHTDTDHPELNPESVQMMSPEALAEFSQHTKWSPYVWAQTNPEKLDDATLTKLGKTDVLLRQQGWKLSDIPFETVVTAIPHMVKGLFTAEKKFLQGVAIPFMKGEFLSGEPAKPDVTKARLEGVAGLETEAVGFADLFRRTYNRLGRFLEEQKPLDQYNDEDAKNLFTSELSARNQLLQVSQGEGEVTKWLGGSKLAELKKTGFKLDPDEINNVSAAGILTLPVFGGAFKLVNAATGKIVGTALSESAAVRALANIRALRKFEAGAEKLAADIPSAENIAARSAAQIETGAAREAATPLVQALEVGERAVEAIPGAPQIVGRAAQAAGKTIEGVAKAASAVLPGIKYLLPSKAAQRVGAGIARAGEEIATEAGGGTWTRAMQDVLRVPGKVVGGALTHGAPMDIGLLALTAETPEEAQQTPLMGTAFGGIGGLIRAGKGFAQGQLIAARPWGDSSTWTKNYGNFPTLDRLHAETMKIASPGVKQRVGGIRDLAESVGSEVYQFSGPEAMSQAMQSLGIDKASADNAANTSGVAWRNVVDSQGNRRKVILLRDPKSAPHEVGHPLEDIFTPEQQDELHARIAKAYGDEGLLQRAQQESFALATTPEAQARVQQDWMAFLLDENGDGPALAKVKGDTLTTEDMQNAVRKYAAKEILVDTIGAVIEHGTPEMVRDAGVPGIVAKTIAKAFTLLGADPFSGAKYGVLETPLKAPVVEGVKETIAPFAVEGAAPTRVTKPTITPTPRVTTTTPPVSEDKTANAEQARAVAEKASDVPLVADAQSPKQVVSELANAIETGAGVKLTRLSAGEKGIAEPGEAGGAEDLSASLLSNREARRHVIEEFRTMPESAKALTERNLFPDAVWEGKSGELLMRGWAPEVFAANAHKTARVLAELQKAGVSIGDITSLPLDPATGSFTDAGWRQLFDQLSGVVENQKAGATGAGEPLVVPRSATAQGFRAPEQRGVAVPIDQNVADFVNLLFGFRLPKTGMIRGKPLTFAGQKVSEATAPGRAVPRVSAGATEFAGKKAEELGIAGEPIQEINPLRARLQQKIAEARKAGVRVSEPELFESLQQFRVSDIKKVEAAPEIPEFRGNTLTLTAGFTPSSNPRAIKIAAVEDAEGKIYTGAWHGEAFTKARDAGAKPIGYYDIEGLKEPFYREGFLTGEEEFLDRESAAQRAIELGQLNRRAKETTERLGGLESQTFKKGRQFTPAPAKVPVELTGPDGKKYKVTFDGYWDLRSLGRGQEPAFTALENLPGSVSQNSSTMGKSLTEAGYKLPELPKPEFTPSKTKRLQEVADVADEYAKEKGIPYSAPAETVDYPRELGQQISDFYDTAVHSPDDPKVKASYDAFKRETLDQYRAIEKAGYELEPVVSVDSPYKSGADVARDVQENKHLFFNLSESAFGQEGQSDIQLMLEPSGVVWKGKELSYNDLFRAVHDFFAHAKESLSFGPIGEFNAWREHANLYSPEAQGALAAETMGQGAWVHFNREFNRGLKPGEPGFVSYQKRPFAEQKNIVIPEELIAEARGQFTPGKKKALPNAAADEDFDVIHYSSVPGLKKIDPKFFGKGKATPTDLRGGSKSYFFVKDSDFGQDEGIFKDAGLQAYETKISGSKLYDLRTGKPDDLGWRKTVNREEADDIVSDAGYDGIILDTADGRQVVAMFKPTSVKPQGSFTPGKKSFEELWADSLRKDFELRRYLMDNFDDSVVSADRIKRLLTAKFVGESAKNLSRYIQANHPEIYSAATGESQSRPQSEPERIRPQSEPERIRPEQKVKEEPLPSEEGLIRQKNPDIITLDDFQPNMKRFKPGEETDSPSWVLPDGHGVSVPVGAVYHDDAVMGFAEFGSSTDAAQNAGAMRVATFDSSRQLQEYGNGQLGVSVVKKPTDAQIKHIQRMLDNQSLEGPMFSLISIDIQDTNGNVLRGRNFNSFEAGAALRYLRNLGEEPKPSFTPGKKFESETFDLELEKIRAGESGGQTFTAEGEVWSPEGKNLDVVTLASVNLPAGKVTRESVIDALGAYEELLDEPGVVAGVFSFSKGGKPTVSVDINATVPQKYRANSVDFAKQNDQVSIWDSAKMEEVPTGGKGETKLQTVAEILDAFDSLTRGKKVDVEEIKRQYKEPGEMEQEAALPGLEEIAGKKVIAGSVVAKMTKAEMAKQFPELVIPRRRNEKLSSAITESPLYKAAGSEEVAIKSFGRKLVEFAREYSDHPSYKAGLEWYEKFTPLLKKHFGKDSQLFAELLAATSPQTNVTTNFAYAFDALEGFKSGRFKKPMEKFNQAMDMINDGSWEAWYKRNKFAKEPTPARFLEEWLKKFDAKPRQSNGKFYGQHSIPVLQVFTRKWLDANRGPKTLNFVENLLGTGAEATIDLWADRTMRRVGYSGAAERWRIHPANQGGVSDRDFFFAQKAFRAAAEELGIKPSALQGALWFAEKQYWNEQGWSTLDLGDFRKEIERIPALRAKIKRQLKDKPKEQLGFDLVEPRNKDK